MKKQLLLIALLCSGLGYSQNALDFDGTDDYISTNYSGVLGSADRTFEAWVYVSSSAPATNLTILDYGTNLAYSRNTFLVGGSRNLAYITGVANLSSTAGDVPEDQWTHVAFVMNSGTAYLYVNGTEVASGSVAGVNTPSGMETVRIGQRVAGGSIPFYGPIDEVRIWSVARTPAEIQSNMNSEFCTLPANLEAYYMLNEGTAGANNTGITSAADASANTNDGTLNNFNLNGTTSNWVTGQNLSGAQAVNQTLTLCDGESITIGSNTYSTSGQYTDVLTSVSGCDSTVVTDLTVMAAIGTTQALSECAGFEIIVGSNTYSTTGVYTDVLTAVSGCDSTVVTDLTINTVDNTTTVSGVTITANAAGASYTWINCADNMPVNGETAQSFTATANGDYAVIVDDGTCADTSACVAISSVGLNELENAFIGLFPNPVNDQFEISSSINTPFALNITNSLGQNVKTLEAKNGMSINVADLPNGVYYLQISAQELNKTFVFVKK